MGVDIQRGAAGHVADDGAQRLDVHSVLQRGGGEGVPEIVEPEALTLRPLQHCLEPFPDGGRIHGGILLDRGGEHPAGMNGLLVIPEYLQHRGWEEYRPIVGPGLGWRGHQFAPYPVNLPLYPQRPGAEVQVPPLEGQDLAPAQAGGQLQQQKLVASVLPGLDHQPLDLLRSQDFHFSAFDRREFTAVRWVAEE